MLNFLLGPTLDFLKSNYISIIALIFLIALFASFFYVAINSVKKLKTEVTPFYPFDVFFPQGGTWSIGYFLVAILVLGFLIYFMAKGGFYLSPA